MKATVIAKGLLVNVSRLLLAATFIFSGFVKAVDPLGTLYKAQDYLAALNLAGLVSDWALVIAAVLLSGIEFWLGVMLLFAIQRRVVSKLTLVLMTVMTIITLWLVVGNPVKDCGCFGDAVKISNGVSFAKNIVLTLCAAIVTWRPLTMVRFISKTNQWIVTNYTALFILVTSMWCLYDLPLFDFRPYHIGADIRKGMEIPPGAKQPEFETTFILKKNGVEKEFTIDNYPDSTWQFVDSKTVQTAEGYVPPIHDFSIELVDGGQDITQQVVNDPSYTFLLVSPHLEVADDSNFGEIDRIYEYSLEHGYKFYCLTASPAKAIAHWRDITGAEYPFATTDETTLKTIIRSNPGLLLLKDGKVIGKWSHNRLPTEDQMQGDLDKIPLGHLSGDNVARKIALIITWFILPLLLLTITDRLWAWSRIVRKEERQNKLSKLFKHKTMRKKIVAGNWKMNMNLQEGIALAKELNENLTADKPNCGVIICTPFIHLASVAQFLNQDIIGLGAENCADKEKGAFTGEVSAEMVKSTGAQYVILGHSERRQYYNETPEILKTKVELALKNGLKVIFCIGETLEEREAGKQVEVVEKELEGSVFNLSADEFKNIIIAYEPIWAIGTGKTATADQAEDIHAAVRKAIEGKYGKEVAENTTILYGGSCKPTNAKELFAKPDIDGGLIGGASLKAADFKGIIDAWK